MSDLHSPLKRPESGIPAKTWITWGASAVGVALLSLSAYILIDSQEDNKQVVALNEATEVKPPATKPKQSAEDAKKNPLVVGEDGKIDVSKMTPLTPLEPIDQEDGAPEPEQPAFKPKPSPPKKLSDWVPIPDLVERTKFGPLPKISEGGLRPLDAYSQSSGMVGANRIALIVGGLGLSQTGTQKAIADLPAEITLGFSPFGNSLQRWMQKARREGHEVILQIPMEPLGYPAIDPGPRTLTSKATPEENLKNLRWLMGRMTNYPLVMNYLGAGLMTKPNSLEPLLEEIRNRGLGYIDDGSVIASRALTLAKDMRLPNAKGATTVDSLRDPEKIKAKLRNLEAMARQRGFVLASATAFPETVAVIAQWVKSAQKRGIHIVPASNLLKDYTP